MAGKRKNKSSKQTKKVAKAEETKEMKTGSWNWLYVALVVIGGLLAAGVAQIAESDSDNDVASALAVYDHYLLLEVLPHDPQAFTQGLTFDGATLWEGTGNYGLSQLRRVDPETGIVQQSHGLDSQYFGEGITFYHDGDDKKRLIQITWRENKGFSYDAETFEVIKEFDYNTKTQQGWGITYNKLAKEFIVTDGSEYIFFWDRDTLKEKRRMQVYNTDEGGTKVPLPLLNEIEFVDGYLLSNVWYKDIIVKIDIKTGEVVKEYDFSELFLNRPESADCFNGISVTDKPNELWVTGKWWPHMYRVKMLG